MTTGPAGISRRWLLITAAGVGSAMALPAAARAGAPTQPAGHLHEIGSLGGPGMPSEATDINDRGDVVGATALPGTQTSHAFIMNPRVQGGRLVDLTPSEPRSSRAEAVNRFGVVTGTLGMGVTPSAGLSATAHTLVGGAAVPAVGGNVRQQPFVWSPRTGVDILPLPPGSANAQASDINDRGMVLVIGTNDIPDPNVPGAYFPVGSFLWDPAERTYAELPLPALSADAALVLASSLDQRGGAAGGVVTRITDQFWQHTAVVWDPHTLAPHVLSSGGVTDSFALDRNDNGMTVGWRMNVPSGSSSAVYWPSRDSAPVPLDGRVALEVNERDQIVGVRDGASSAPLPFAAVLWEPGRDRTTELDDHNLGAYAVAVNSSGASAGYAVVATSDNRHYNTAVWWGPC